MTTPDVQAPVTWQRALGPIAMLVLFWPWPSKTRSKWQSMCHLMYEKTCRIAQFPCNSSAFLFSKSLLW